MKPEVLTALESAVEKWKGVVGGNIDHGIRNCPLCKIFYSEFKRKGCCDGCPVRDHTGKKYCIDSPYERWIAHHDEDLDHDSDEYQIECDECKSLAQQEVEFLQELLEKGVKENGSGTSIDG